VDELDHQVSNLHSYTCK